MPDPLSLTRHFGRAAAQTGHDFLGPYLLRVIWSLATLSAFFLALRLYCPSSVWYYGPLANLLVLKLMLLVSVILQTVGVNYGLGKHYDTLREENTIIQVSFYSYLAGFFPILATSWAKTSFALSLLRITTSREMRWSIWAIIVVVNLVFASNGIIHTIQNFNIFVAAFSGLMDIVLALLPWKIIWTVAINKREKLGALVAMSAGVLAGVMSFLKIKTVFVIGDDNSTTVDLFIFGTAEPATAIMAASIPVLRALIHREPHSKPARFIELGNPRFHASSTSYGYHMPRTNARDNYYKKIEEERAARQGL
ncbi:hypothetical protein N0V88_007623 [Collariella sp. IMI 366227]|nr:hypothetical protein N0V88_007623 [Collariella sp. IMI 366227]